MRLSRNSRRRPGRWPERSLRRCRRSLSRRQRACGTAKSASRDRRRACTTPASPVRSRPESVYFLFRVGSPTTGRNTEAAIAFWAREAFGFQSIRVACAANRVSLCSVSGVLPSFLDMHPTPCCLNRFSVHSLMSHQMQEGFLVGSAAFFGNARRILLGFVSVRGERLKTQSGTSTWLLPGFTAFGCVNITFGVSFSRHRRSTAAACRLDTGDLTQEKAIVTKASSYCQVVAGVGCRFMASRSLWAKTRYRGGP